MEGLGPWPVSPQPISQVVALLGSAQSDLCLRLEIIAFVVCWSDQGPCPWGASLGMRIPEETVRDLAVTGQQHTEPHGRCHPWLKAKATGVQHRGELPLIC